MNAPDDELRLLRDRLDHLERRLESRVQDDGGAPADSPDLVRLIRLPLAGIVPDGSARCDWRSTSGWQTGTRQIVVHNRMTASTSTGLDPRSGANRLGYAARVDAMSEWQLIQEAC